MKSKKLEMKQSIDGHRIFTLSDDSETFTLSKSVRSLTNGEEPVLLLDYARAVTDMPAVRQGTRIAITLSDLKQLFPLIEAFESFGDVPDTYITCEGE